MRLLEGKETKGSWRKIEDWVGDNVDPSREVIAVGTGGNISKLFNLASKTAESETTLAEIERIRNHVASFSLDDRINKLRLNADRADVIVPAADIYISVMRWARATQIIVPDLGLKDGIIQLVYAHLSKKKRVS